MPALLRYFSDLIHFKTSKLNPIPLHGNPILDNFVFKHAAVADWKDLCLSAFVRVATSNHDDILQLANLCLSAFVRVATASSKNPASHACALPQRIRAGCDAGAERQLSRHVLCHSAFARVATLHHKTDINADIFATAHSRGLRLHPSATDTATCFFASAHSRGLRLHQDC